MPSKSLNSPESDEISLDLGVTGEVDSFQQKNPPRELSSILMQLTQTLHASAPLAWEWMQARRNNVRPWTTFLAASRFKKPASIPRMSSRLRKNIEYFQSNYMFVFVGLIIFCLLTSPLLLLAVAASLGACYILFLKNVERKIVIAGYEVPIAQQYGAVAVFSIPIFYLAGAGGAIFWVLGASFLVIMLHASLYNIDIILGSEDEPFDLQMDEIV